MKQSEVILPPFLVLYCSYLMICRRCNHKIDEDSNYCCYCGQKQPFTIEKFFFKGIVYYPIWAAVHIMILVFFSDRAFHADNANQKLKTFWPFNPGMAMRVYDITEFILYTLIPLLFILFFLLLRKNK